MSQVTCTIADDTMFFRRIMMDICRNLNIEVLKDYETGELLLQELQDEDINHPDIIFLDINMPGRSGKDLLEDLLDASPESIIIMISTVSDASVVKECLNLGATNYINKDSDLKTMKEIIHSTMKINGLLDD